MNASEFIISQLNTLIVQIPTLQIRYEYEEFDKSHYIEILPEIEFKLNLDYIKFETEFYQEFTKLYTNEYIAFLSVNSLYEIETPIYSKTGSLFGHLNKYYSNDLLFKNTNCTILNNKVKTIFTKKESFYSSKSNLRENGQYVNNQNNQPNLVYSNAA